MTDLSSGTMTQPSRRFIKQLTHESQRWQEASLISKQQREDILAIYPRSQASRSFQLQWVLVGLATVLLSLGFILFYAANWPAMAPLFKQAQVFCLIVACYAAAYYFLFVTPHYLRIGRALSVVGMVSFGVGIALTAQIYHISSHPSNGILAWALAAFAMASLLKEPWGFYLAWMLSALWNMWEVTVYAQPNFGYLVWIVLLAVQFYRSEQRFGLLLCGLSLLLFYLQILFESVLPLSPDDQEQFFAWLSCLPLGLLLLMSERGLEKLKHTDWLRVLFSLSGWVGLLLPLFVLSWPFNIELPLFPVRHASPATGFYLGLSLLSLVLGGVLYRFKILPWWALAAAFMPSLFLVLPIGNLSLRMTVFHLLIVTLYGGTLYASTVIWADRRVEPRLLWLFLYGMIAVKSIGFFAIGFFASGMEDKHFLVAYTMGAVVFVTVCFLINLALQVLLQRRGLNCNHNRLNAFCALAVFLLFYGLSFGVNAQTPLTQAATVVWVLLGLFSLLALGLYGWLWKSGQQRLPVGLSAVVFCTALGLLCGSGPWLGWVAYSLILNAVLLMMSVLLIYHAYKVQNSVLLNLAICAFLLHVITRYFDLFWDMLSGSLLFILSGLLALVGGYLIERNRRRLISSMKS